jgi:hypothetical protein
MENYTLTNNGRAMIKVLELDGNTDDAAILKHLDLAITATEEQVAYSTRLSEAVVKQKMAIFLDRRWVRANITKLSRF